jgi:hypothetical protein
VVRAGTGVLTVWGTNLNSQETEGRADHGHHRANHGQSTPHHGQFQGVAGDFQNGAWTQEDVSQTLEDDPETIISTKRLQNSDRTSGAILRTIRQSPDLGQVAAIWMEFPPTIRLAILNLVKPQDAKDTRRINTGMDSIRVGFFVVYQAE